MHHRFLMLKRKTNIFVRSIIYTLLDSNIMVGDYYLIIYIFLMQQGRGKTNIQGQKEYSHNVNDQGMSEKLMFWQKKIE